MLENYNNLVKERKALGIPPLPLDVDQTAELIGFIKVSTSDDKELLDLLINRVPAGVDDAAYIKAAFLTDISQKKKYLVVSLALKKLLSIWALCWEVITLSL
jgi:aconitate hydratase 2/2-methylisocitrate dehydratase